jgi:hypothetical protein
MFPDRGIHGAVYRYVGTTVNGPCAGHPGKSTRRKRRKREPCDRTAGPQPSVRLVENCLISTRLSAIRKSRVTQSQFVTWVGATCAGCAHPDSCLGRFDPSAQHLHLSAQRQSAKQWRETPPDRVRAEEEVPEVDVTCAQQRCVSERRWGRPQVRQHKTCAAGDFRKGWSSEILCEMRESRSGVIAA